MTLPCPCLPPKKNLRQRVHCEKAEERGCSIQIKGVTSLSDTRTILSWQCHTGKQFLPFLKKNVGPFCEWKKQVVGGGKCHVGIGGKVYKSDSYSGENPSCGISPSLISVVKSSWSLFKAKETVEIFCVTTVHWRLQGMCQKRHRWSWQSQACLFKPAPVLVI